jgi:ADP-heptose:LPS heptosyltransferase
MFHRPKNWPKSLPDYDWPAVLRGPGRAAGRVACAAVFHACYLLGRVLSLVIRSRPAAVVIRTDGIGDAILFEPALEALARSLSPHDLHVWAPAATCEVIGASPVVRKRVGIPRGFKEGNLLVYRSVAWRARLGFLLGFRSYEIAIYPAESPEPLGNWLLTSVRARIRWVNYGDTINQHDWQRAATHARVTRVLSIRPGAAHELIRNAYLSTQWGGSLDLRPPRIHPTAKAVDEAERQVQQWRHVERQVRGSGVVAVIPTGSQPINRYPAEKWEAVLRQLWQEHRAMGALLGGPGDEEFIDSITDRLGEVPFLRPGRVLGVLATAALIGRVDALISVDTGLAHAAIAQDVPSIILRIGGDPGRFFPWPGAHRSIVLSRAMPCEGCHNRCHLGEAKCITDVPPEEVVAAYAKLSVSRSIIEYAAPAARWMKVAG